MRSLGPPARKAPPAAAPEMPVWLRVAYAVAASLVLLLLALAGSTLLRGSPATAANAAAHPFNLTDNPGNWFDSGADIVAPGLWPSLRPVTR
jgi:hypothetical protein